MVWFMEHCHSIRILHLNSEKLCTVLHNIHINCSNLWCGCCSTLQKKLLFPHLYGQHFWGRHKNLSIQLHFNYKKYEQNLFSFKNEIGCHKTVTFLVCRQTMTFFASLKFFPSPLPSMATDNRWCSNSRSDYCYKKFQFY